MKNKTPKVKNFIFDSGEFEIEITVYSDTYHGILRVKSSNQSILIGNTSLYDLQDLINKAIETYETESINLKNGK